MPIYEFCCQACGKVFEQLVFGSDAPVACPACHSPKVEKLLSACSLSTGCAAPAT